MRLKLVSKINKQDVILVGKVEGGNLHFEQINKILVELHHPILKEFPYKDSQKLVERIKFRKSIRFSNGKLRRFQFINERNCLNADLNVYFRDISALAFSVKRLDKKDLNELRKYQNWLSKEFFEHWQQYLPLKFLINPRIMPSLFEQLRLHSELRLLLLAIISEIIKTKQIN